MRQEAFRKEAGHQIESTRLVAECLPSDWGNFTVAQFLPVTECALTPVSSARYFAGQSGLVKWRRSKNGGHKHEYSLVEEHCRLDDGKVRWLHYEVKGADFTVPFEPLNHIWARDANRVYTHNRVNKLADRETFRVLNHISRRTRVVSSISKGGSRKPMRIRFAFSTRADFPGTRLTRQTPEWHYSGFGCDATHVFHDDMMSGKPCVLRRSRSRSMQFFNLATRRMQPRCSVRREG